MAKPARTEERGARFDWFRSVDDPTAVRVVEGNRKNGTGEYPRSFPPR